MNHKRVLILFVVVLALLIPVSVVTAQGPAPRDPRASSLYLSTAFTYQGQIKKGGTPVTASCLFDFRLYDHPSVGNLVGGPLGPNVPVTNGLFSVTLDFGAAFTGEARWLGIQVQCPGDGGYTDLGRQLITATPYALSLRPGSVISGTIYNGPVLQVYNTDSSTGGGYAISAINYSSNAWRPAIYGENKGASAGVYGRSDGGNAVVGWNQSNNSSGVWGNNIGTGNGVRGDSDNGTGVYGSASYTGVVGIGTGNNGIGVYGEANNGSSAYGVYGTSSSGYAGYFSGNVYVSGIISTGGTKPFEIDNPLDPRNQYLFHYAVESPQVENVYNGTITLNAQGEAVVNLPAYFSAINTGDYRYYLTPIGAPMPNLYVADEIQGNTFKIAGGVAGKKVSWMVYGLRNDPWVRDHPQMDVVAKPANELGTFLYPQGYGQPDSSSINYRRFGQSPRQTAVTTKP